MWAAAGPSGGSAPSRDEIAAGLRAWAHGLYPYEAGVELLIRAFGGRLLHGPWIVADTDAEGGAWWYVDPDQVADAGYLSGGELRMLRLAVSLISDAWPVSLGETLPALDRSALGVVLAAVEHANGNRSIWADRTGATS